MLLVEFLRGSRKKTRVTTVLRKTCQPLGNSYEFSGTVKAWKNSTRTLQGLDTSMVTVVTRVARRHELQSNGTNGKDKGDAVHPNMSHLRAYLLSLEPRTLLAKLRLFRFLELVGLGHIPTTSMRVLGLSD